MHNFQFEISIFNTLTSVLMLHVNIFYHYIHNKLRKIDNIIKIKT